MSAIDSHQFLKALSFAADMHRFQKRKDTAETPYINHPIKVALTLAEIGRETNQNLLIASILHDTIEDTETSPEKFALFFVSGCLGWSWR